MQNRVRKVMRLLPLVLIWMIVAVVLSASIRGRSGPQTESDLPQVEWTKEGPFELSPERGRYALTYSLVENNSPFFSVPLARFTAPDLGYLNGKFVSLFAPGVSYIIMPGYLAGKIMGNAQVGAYAVIALFALVNSWLIIKITRSVGISLHGAVLAALIFLFATPAFAYGVNLYQHHISTFLILMSLRLLTKSNSFFSLSLIWFLCALSIPIDYPNLILMLPIGFVAAGRFFRVKRGRKTVLHIYPTQLLTLLSVVLPLTFFLWFNNMSYGNPLQFSGTVPSVTEVDIDGKPAPPKTVFSAEEAEKYLKPELQEKSVLNFFNSRYLVNGLYLHLLSPDRGIIYFAPVILLGLWGAYFAYKKYDRLTVLLLAIALANLLLYSLWGDPWGGWAFGSRYLIPAYAILCILLAFYIERFRRNILALTLLLIVVGYSTYVNTAGALSTSANPPYVEVLSLEELSGKRERYSFDRNIEYLQAGKSKSFVYQTWANRYMSTWEYFRLIAGTIAVLMAIQIMLVYTTGKKDVYEKS